MRSGQPVCLAEWTCCSTSHFAKCLSHPGRRMFPVSPGRSMALSFASSVMAHDTLASGSHDHSAPPAPASRRRRSRAAGLPQGDATSLLGAWTLNREDCLLRREVTRMAHRDGSEATLDPALTRLCL